MGLVGHCFHLYSSWNIMTKENVMRSNRNNTLGFIFIVFIVGIFYLAYQDSTQSVSIIEQVSEAINNFMAVR